jgi:hypothetical protein
VTGPASLTADSSQLPLKLAARDGRPRCETMLTLALTRLASLILFCTLAFAAPGQVRPLRANIAETLLVPLITEQGGKEIQHEEYEDILSGPVGRAQ